MSDQEPRFPSTEDIMDRVAAINKVTGNPVALENHRSLGKSRNRPLRYNQHWKAWRSYRNQNV